MTSDPHVRVTHACGVTESEDSAECSAVPSAAASDDDLVARLRAGTDAAFAELFEAHAPAVRRFAHGLASDASQAEDITAETFFRVLQALKRGNGPKDSVRAYLLTVARRVAWEWKGAERDVPVTDDELTTRAGCSEHNAARTAEYSLITRAFSSLPERWRSVLWQTEVEGEQPAVVAPHFGLSPNAASALARRARQGLRAAYLQAHLAGTAVERDCRSVLGKLGSYTAGGVSGAEARRISAHLGSCAGCRSNHDELRDVCFSLRAHAAGLEVLVPAAAVAGAASAGASGGLLGTWKSALGTAKVKVAAAVASTAAVGVFGLTAGPVFTDVDNLGLSGQQGAPPLTAERSTVGPPAEPRVVDDGPDAARPEPVAELAQRDEPIHAIDENETVADQVAVVDAAEDEISAAGNDEAPADDEGLSRSGARAAGPAADSPTADGQGEPAEPAESAPEPAEFTGASTEPAQPESMEPESAPAESECSTSESSDYSSYEYVSPSGTVYFVEVWEYTSETNCGSGA